MRILFYAVLLMWILGSAVCTALNVNVWPFPSLNVFSDLPKEKSGQWVIRYKSANQTHELDPGNVLPVEFFVARSIVGETIKSKDESKIAALLDYVYVHARESRPGFDERWEKPKLNLSSSTHIQIVLKVFKLGRVPRIRSILIEEHILAEKSYVR